jgi:hypothetical protein
VDEVDDLLGEREDRKWDSFSWITLRALISSVNHVISLGAGSLVTDLRTEWRRCYSPVEATAGWDADGVVNRREDTSCIVLGDPGEQDASQYVVVPALRQKRDEAQFMVILSDVIYPSGDVNDYVDGFYVPYRGLGLPIYALPGNHDWYDGLAGFMWNFCDAEPLAATAYGGSGGGLLERLCRLLWRRPSPRRARARLEERRAECQPVRDGWAPCQPGPYYAIDTKHVRLVCIDTGIEGEIDRNQAKWLVRVSRCDLPTVLLTGKPLYVDRHKDPCDIRDGPVRVDGSEYHSVAEIVADPEHGYVATIGGDIHNYQHYEVDGIHHVVSGGGGAYMSATHPAAVAVHSDWAEGEEVEPVTLYPEAPDSLRRFARLLLPMVWRLERIVLAFALGLIAALVWVHRGRDAGLREDVLGWGAIGLGTAFAVRVVLPASFTRTAPYRAFAVLAALLAGAVVALAGWWLAPARLDENVAGLAGLVGGGALLAGCMRVTGWWRRREHEQEIETSRAVLVGFAFALLPASAGYVAWRHDVRWQVVVAAAIVAAAAGFGWWARGRRWWTWATHVTAYVAQLLAALFLLDGWIVPAGAHGAFWAAAILGLVGLVFVAVFLALALLVVEGCAARVTARRRRIELGAARGVVGGGVQLVFTLLIPLAVSVYCLALWWLPADAQRAAVTAVVTVMAPVVAAFLLDFVRRYAGGAYKPVVAALLGILLYALLFLDAHQPWVPRAVVAGAVLLTLALVGIIVAHLVFLGAHALAWDRPTHADREQLTTDQAKDVLAWRRGADKPGERAVRRRANVVFPGATQPNGPLQRKISEICDSDSRPFRKNFLILNADRDELVIKPCRVTGYKTPEGYWSPGKKITIRYSQRK